MNRYAALPVEGDEGGTMLPLKKKNNNKNRKRNQKKKQHADNSNVPTATAATADPAINAHHAFASAIVSAEEIMAAGPTEGYPHYGAVMHLWHLLCRALSTMIVLQGQEPVVLQGDQIFFFLYHTEVFSKGFLKLLASGHDWESCKTGGGHSLSLWQHFFFGEVVHLVGEVPIGYDGCNPSDVILQTKLDSIWATGFGHTKRGKNAMYTLLVEDLRIKFNKLKVVRDYERACAYLNLRGEELGVWLHHVANLKKKKKGKHQHQHRQHYAVPESVVPIFKDDDFPLLGTVPAKKPPLAPAMAVEPAEAVNEGTVLEAEHEDVGDVFLP